MPLPAKTPTENSPIEDLLPPIPGAQDVLPATEPVDTPDDSGSNPWSEMSLEGDDEVVIDLPVSPVEPLAEPAPEAVATPTEPTDTPPAEIPPVVDGQPLAEPAPVEPAPEEPIPQQMYTAEQVQNFLKWQQQQAATQPAQPVQTPEERQALAQQATQALAEAYQLDEDTAVALQTDPGKVFPQLAAKIQEHTQNQVLEQVVRAAPAYIARMMQQQSNSQALENQFFESWPALREHAPQVKEFALMWRQMNQNATLEQAISEVGKHASIALGLPVDPAQVNLNQPAPPAPAAVPTPAPVAGVAPAPAPPSNVNQFSAFTEMLDNEE